MGADDAQGCLGRPQNPLRVIRGTPDPTMFLGIVPLCPSGLEEESPEYDDDDTSDAEEEIIPLEEGGVSLESDSNSDVESDGDPFIDELEG